MTKPDAKQARAAVSGDGLSVGYVCSEKSPFDDLGVISRRLSSPGAAEGSVHGWPAPVVAWCSGTYWTFATETPVTKVQSGDVDGVGLPEVVVLIAATWSTSWKTMVTWRGATKLTSK